MTKEEALNIINNALSQVNTTRQGHELLVKALSVLAKNDEPKQEALKNG